jgi:hypothetical protein
MPIALRSTSISVIFTIVEEKVKNLDKLALFLANVVDTWKEARQKQSNKLANILFSQICILDNKVIEVKPVEELRPFFWLSYE